MTLLDAPPKLYTLDEFVKLPGSDHMELTDGVPTIDGIPVELGEPLEIKMAVEERIIQGKVVRFLDEAQDERPVGYAAVEVLVRTDPNNPSHGRRPDVAFITFTTLGNRSIKAEALDVCPDICVEVVSPTNASVEIAGKIAEYLRAGAKLVWEVQPEIHTVIVHRADGTAQRVRGDEVLSGEDVLPAFRVPVSKLFPSR